MHGSHYTYATYRPDRSGPRFGQSTGLTNTMTTTHGPRRHSVVWDRSSEDLILYIGHPQPHGGHHGGQRSKSGLVYFRDLLVFWKDFFHIVFHIFLNICALSFKKDWFAIEERMFFSQEVHIGRKILFSLSLSVPCKITKIVMSGISPFPYLLLCGKDFVYCGSSEPRY